MLLTFKCLCCHRKVQAAAMVLHAACPLHASPNFVKGDRLQLVSRMAPHLCIWQPTVVGLKQYSCSSALVQAWMLRTAKARHHCLRQRQQATVAL